MSEGLKESLKSITSDEKISKVDNSKIDEYLTELDKLESSSKQELQNLMKDYLINTLKSGYEINDKNDYEFLQKISTKFNLGISLPSFNDLLVDATFGIIFKLDENNTDIIIYSGVYKKRVGYIKTGDFIRDPGFFDTFGNNSTNDIKIDFSKIDEVLTKNNSELIKIINSIKTLDDLTSLIPLLDTQNLNSNINNAIKTKVIELLTAGFESSKDIDDDLNNINRIIPLGVQGIGDKANKSIMFGRMYKLGNGKLEEINPNNHVAAQNQQAEGTTQQTDTKTASSDQGKDDTITHAAADADASRVEDNKKLPQRKNNQYYNEKGAKISNDPKTIGNYSVNITNGVLNIRDLRGNDIGNLQKGVSITTTGNYITLGKEKFLEVKGGNNTYYVAAEYLTKEGNKAEAKAKETNSKAKKEEKTETITLSQETSKAEQSQTDNKDSQTTGSENVDLEVVVTPSISGNDFNKAIQARGKTITLGNGTEIRKVTNGFRVTENDVSYRISEKSVMEKGNRFYKSPTDINKALLSAKNTETAKEELAKIKDEIDKLSMTVSEFFVNPIQPHEQAWIDTLSGDEVTLNNISVTKDHNNNTVITFDIDDFFTNNDINSGFLYNIPALGQYIGNEEFKKVFIIPALKEKVYEEPKREEILVEYEKIKDALNNALQNPNQKQEIGEMYNEKITIEFDGKQFYAQIGSDNQIGLTQITHSSTEITFPEGYLNTVLKDAIEGKIQYYNNLKSSK